MTDFVKKRWPRFANTDTEPGTSGSRYVAFLNSVVLLVLVLIVQNFVLAAVFYPETLPISILIIGHFFSDIAAVSGDGQLFYWSAAAW